MALCGALGPCRRSQSGFYCVAMGKAYAVILAGGSGTRFWPASRRMRPKQLLSVGPGKDSLIATTVRRIESVIAPEQVFVATGEHLLEQTTLALPWLRKEAFLAEPLARNTAACIGWASSVIRRRDPQAVVAVFPSDQYIGEPAEFLVAVEEAIQAAHRGVITTIGIRPTRAETGYGYIELGDELAAGGFQVRRFVEKPDLVRAREYLMSGEYLWNSGMFFFRAEVMLEAIRHLMPDLAKGLERIDDASRHGPDAERWEVRKTFEALESVSIDYGVMERMQDLAVIPADCGWSDVGSWESVWELEERDSDANVLPASATAVESHGNVVVDLRAHPDERTIALLGVEGLCVVQTEDALLIVPRSRAQDTRLVVEALKARKRDALL